VDDISFTIKALQECISRLALCYNYLARLLPFILMAKLVAFLLGGKYMDKLG
jgi:hypothetical protein